MNRKKQLLLALAAMFITFGIANAFTIYLQPPVTDCTQYSTAYSACSGTNSYTGCGGLAEDPCKTNPCCRWYVYQGQGSCVLKDCSTIGNACPCSQCTGCTGSNWIINDGSNCTAGVDFNVTGYLYVDYGTLTINAYGAVCEYVDVNSNGGGNYLDVNTSAGAMLDAGALPT